VTKTIYLIVEGDGEVKAAPELVRRILHEWCNRFEFTVARPFNAQGVDSLEANFVRFLELARRDRQGCQGLIVLRDTERDNCAEAIAYNLAGRAANLKLPFPVVIVCAVCEYESWFLASMQSISPHYTWTESVKNVEEAELECNAKGWLKRRMPKDARTYQETRDQVTMTTLIDMLDVYEHCRSFRRMVHAVEELLQAIDAGTYDVTPLPKQ